MANSDLASHTTTVKDVKQLGIWAAIGSLSYVFWICGGMEMVERLAYYGVRQVSSLYIEDSRIAEIPVVRDRSEQTPSPETLAVIESAND